MKGQCLYKELDDLCVKYINKYKELKTIFDLSHRDLDFRYSEFCKDNPYEDFWEEYFEYFIQSILLSIIEKPDSFSINHIYTFIREIHDKAKNNGIIYFPQLLALNIFLNVNKKELKRRALTDNNISNFMKMLIILIHAKKNKDNYSKKLYRDLFEEISSNKIISVDKFRKLSQVFQIDKLWYV